MKKLTTSRRAPDRMRWAWPLLCLVSLHLFGSCTPSDTPGEGVAPRERFPSFEPFEASRMWKLVGGVTALPPARAAGEIEAFLEKSATMSRPEGKAKGEGPGARLSADSQEPKAPVYFLVPAVISYLRRHWENPEWNEDELGFARSAAKMLGTLPRFPGVEFASKAHGANRRALARILDWFEAECRRPAVLAKMIFTLDDGPFVGLPVEASRVESAKKAGELRFGSGMRFELFEEGSGAEPFLMRVSKDDAPLWTRRLSCQPDGDARKAWLHGSREPTRLGPYGWKLHLTVDGPGGAEYTHLYLDAKGELLFYFVSW